MTPNRPTPPSTRSKRRGGGPRSAAGKAIASCNALRHGFSANLYRQSPAPERIERLARAISGGDRDPAVVALAYKIAENQLLLSEIAMHKVAVVERLRERYANPLSSKDNSLQLATARFLQAWLEHREIAARIPALLQKYELRLTVEALSKSRDDYAADLEQRLPVLFPEANQRAAIIEEWLESWVESQTARLKAQGWRTSADDIVPVQLKALLEELDESETSARTERGREIVLDRSEERDEYEAVEAAALDLIRLERYQQRAWSRQKRAILELATIKLERRLRQDTGPAGA
jgi:hypothetical protein